MSWDKMYCLPCVRADVDALREAIGDSLDDLVPLAVVDDVALEVEVSPLTVVSCVKKMILIVTTVSPSSLVRRISKTS